MSLQDEYKVELEVFEGPLDLLLYLIKKDEVDIYNIPIEQVTSQYMEYLNMMRMLDLNIAGEFIVMAATLMMIKSRMLLPVEERMEEEEEDEEDPRWDLVRQLVEYKKFKDAAERLHERELHQENVFDLGADGAVLEPDGAEVVLEDVTLFDLLTAFKNVLDRARDELMGEILGDQFSVADKIDTILGRLEGGGRVAFSALFGESPSKPEVVCTFLALLELLRLRQVAIHQSGPFADIEIRGLAQESGLAAPVEA